MSEVEKTLGNRAVFGDNNADKKTERRGACNTIDAPNQSAEEAREDMADLDSTPGKAPAFQFYPNDFLADANVAVMSMQERGIYITLICYCWQQGSLPNDPARLAALCLMPVSAFQKLWPAISPCFKPHASGERLLHPRLERERRKHRAYRKLQSDKGKLGGRPKKPELSAEKAAAFPSVDRDESRTLRDDKAEKSSSIFKLQSSSSTSDSGQVPAPVNARSKRPIFSGQSFVVFEWQLDDLRRMLGAHAESFDLHEWFFALDERARAAGLVVPQRDGGKWLQGETLAEAMRRGLPVAASAAPGVNPKTAGNQANAAIWLAGKQAI